MYHFNYLQYSLNMVHDSKAFLWKDLNIYFFIVCTDKNI